MASAASQVNTKLSAASVALEAGDSAAALLLLESAQILLAGIPDTQRGNDQLTWDRSAIANTIKTLRQRRNAAAGLRSTKLKRVRPGIVT